MDDTQCSYLYQLNSKFVNNMLPEWGRFVTAVKLSRGMKESNYDQLTSSNTRNQATIEDGRVVVQNVQGRQNRGQGNNARGTPAAGNGGAQNRVGNANPGQARQDKCYNCNGGQDNAVDEDTIFMASLSSADPVYDKASPSYDSDILSEDNAEPVVQNNVSSIPNDAYLMIINEMHDQTPQCVSMKAQNKVVNASLTAELATYKEQTMFMGAVDENHEVHDMHNDVQPNYVVDSNAEYTSDSNMIPYDHYVKDNAEPVVQNNVSSMPNDAYMMIINEMHEHAAQCVSANEQNKVVNASLTAELARYKEQVKLYKRWAKFELTEREQKIDETN
ncbi:hypothetical protein Tco_0452879 [Tanacetum coccineum]